MSTRRLLLELLSAFVLLACGEAYGPLTNAAIRRLFERIIDEARSAERVAMHGDSAEEKDSK